MRDLTTEEWYQVQQRAVGLRIELVQQQAREVCDDEDPLACAQAWAQANQAVEGLVREAALQPQTVYTPPEPHGEACLPSEVAYYMQRVEAVDAAYESLLTEGQAAPERLTALAEAMAAVGQEAAAWGCGGVAAEAQLRARDIAEAARHAQEAEALEQWVSESTLPPADYVVLAGSLSLLAGSKKIAQILKANKALRWLEQAEKTRVASWLSGGASLIWVAKCQQLLVCRGGSVGISPGSVSGKLTQGWFVGPSPSCKEMASFFANARGVEGGYGWGGGYLRANQYTAVETGMYSPQISVSGVLPTTCEVKWEAKP